jgi:hypothetical protein
MQLVERHREAVAVAISQSLGLWLGAVQLDLALVRDDATWLGMTHPYQRGGTGKRLDRYLTDEVLEQLTREKKGLADWVRLAERPAEVKILLRRLRYRLGVDYGAENRPNYAVWTTPTTMHWASQGKHNLAGLVWTLSRWVDDSVLLSGGADLAVTLEAGYWGEVDTEIDPLRVGEMTTPTGVTAQDVREVLARAGAQVERTMVPVQGKSDNDDPVLLFTDALRDSIAKDGLSGLDVLLIHRGGGLVPSTPRRSKSNVSDARRVELLDLCRQVRDLGTEVVVALGHADISVLDSEGLTGKELPLGIFEATTPTAGAAWILQEHVNPRLVDTATLFGQPH